MSRHAAGSAAIAGCALAWGFVSIIVRELDMPPLVIVFYRVALAALVIALVLAATGRASLLRPPSFAPLALGLLTAAHWGLFFAAIKETSVASAALVTYTGPVFIALAAPAVLGEHVSRRSLAALGVSLAGIALILTAGGDAGEVRALGVGLAVLAAFSFAAIIVLVRRLAPGIDPATLALYETIGATCVLWPAAIVADYSIDAEAAGYLATLGIGLTAVALIVYAAAIRHVPATSAGILMYAEPVSAAVLAAALLGEALTPAIALGGALIVGAGVTVARAEEPAPVPAA